MQSLTRKQPAPACGGFRRRHLSAGFTLVELLITIAIILVLASVVFSLSGNLKRRAEMVACSGNMKTIFVGLAAYTNDNKHWPQPPESVLRDEEKFWKFWLESLRSYGIDEKHWVCPTEQRLRRKDGEETWKSSYLVTGFDGSSASKPYRWANQPWLMEVGDYHGKGGLILRPDGSVRPMELRTDLEN